MGRREEQGPELGPEEALFRGRVLAEPGPLRPSVWGLALCSAAGDRAVGAPVPGVLARPGGGAQRHPGHPVSGSRGVAGAQHGSVDDDCRRLQTSFWVLAE